METKIDSDNIEIDHNIFSSQIPANEQGTCVQCTKVPLRGYRNHGTLTLHGKNDSAHDNILRHNKSGWGPFVVAEYANHDVFNNVVYDEIADGDYPTKYAIRAYGEGADFGLAKSHIRGNTFCKLTSYVIAGDPGLDVHDNHGLDSPGAAPSECDAEVQRILKEMQELRSETIAPTCVASAGGWSNRPTTAKTGTFTVEFDATPSQKYIDAVVELSASPADAYTDLAAIVRFNRAGNIDRSQGL